MILDASYTMCLRAKLGREGAANHGFRVKFLRIFGPFCEPWKEGPAAAIEQGVSIKAPALDMDTFAWQTPITVSISSAGALVKTPGSTAAAGPWIRTHLGLAPFYGCWQPGQRSRQVNARMGGGQVFECNLRTWGVDRSRR